MTEMLTGACGCVVELEDDGSPIAARKREKLFTKGCSACRTAAHEKLMAESIAAKAAQPKGSSVPAGTLIAIKKREDGTWMGTLDSDDMSATAMDVSLHKLIKSLLEQANRWRLLGLEAGTFPLQEALPPIRVKSRSIIDKRSPKPGLSPPAVRRILDAIEASQPRGH